MSRRIANLPTHLPISTALATANDLCLMAMNDLLSQGSRQSIDDVLTELNRHYRAVPAKVLPVARRTYRCALRMGYTRGVAAALHYEGHAQAELGQFSVAAFTLKRCVTIAKRANESEIVRRASRMLINCEFQCDLFDSAVRRCVAFASALDHPDSSDDSAWVINVMGLTLARARQFERALLLFEHTYIISRKLSSPNQFRELLYIGICRQHRGEYDLAQVAFSNSLKGLIESNDQFNRCVCLARLGLNQAYCGSHLGAKNLLTEAAELAHSIGGCYLISEYHVIAGLAYLKMAINDEAKAHFEKSLEKAVGVLSDYHLQIIHESLATLHSEKREWQSAYTHIELAHAFHIKLVSMAGSPELERAFHAVSASFVSRVNKRENMQLSAHSLQSQESVPFEKVEKDKPQITRRESEILQQIAAGYSNIEIATHLGISPHTVRFHLVSIYSKLGARRRADAVAIAMREKLIYT
jgi:DNA-binding CsgD family transcriptional regulator